MSTVVPWVTVRTLAAQTAVVGLAVENFRLVMSMVSDAVKFLIVSAAKWAAVSLKVSAPDPQVDDVGQAALAADRQGGFVVGREGVGGGGGRQGDGGDAAIGGVHRRRAAAGEGQGHLARPARQQRPRRGGGRVDGGDARAAVDRLGRGPRVTVSAPDPRLMTSAKPLPPLIARVASLLAVKV